MQKASVTLRVSADAAQRARRAGLCLSRTAERALIESAELLENKKTGVSPAKVQSPVTIPKEGDQIVVSST
jgi:hypothetical protein